jgi:MFS family permease
MPRAETGSFAALAIRNYRMLFAGTLASFTGFFISTVVQGVVAFELEGSNTAVGGVIFGQGIGMLLSGPMGGAFADRLPKRRVLATCQTFSATCFAAIGALYANGLLEIEHLVLNGFFVGCSFGFIGPTRQALVVDLVPPPLLGNAMALTTVANTMSRVSGPLLAGILLAATWAGPAVAYFTMAGLYLVSAALLLTLPRSVVRANVGETHVLQDLTAGLQYTWQNVRLRHLLFFFLGVMLIGFPHVTLIPGLLENQLGHPAEDLTRFAFMSAVGALGASLTVARYADSSEATRLYGWLAIGFGAALVLLAGMPDFVLAVASMLVVGAASGGFQALHGAVIARETDPEYMGRVMSVSMLSFSGFSLSALPLGLLADLFGERWVLLGMGVGVMGVATFMSAVIARDAVGRPAEPAEPVR